MDYTSDLLKVDTVLPSGRFYPRAVVEKAIEKITPVIDVGWFGELDVPVGTAAHGDRISHKVRRVWIDDGGGVRVTIQTLPLLPMGAIVHAQLDGGNYLMLTVRAVEIVNKNDVVTEMEFRAIDVGPRIPKYRHEIEKSGCHRAFV